jgi:pyruvate,water dikinase
VGAIERVDTKIMMNLANPEQAYSLQFIPNDGVGLVRMEFIVSNHIRAHPMALLRPDKLQQVLSLPPHPLSDWMMMMMMMKD